MCISDMGFPDENFCDNAPFNQKDKKVTVVVGVEMEKEVTLTIPEGTKQEDYDEYIGDVVNSLRKDGWEVDNVYVEER